MGGVIDLLPPAGLSARDGRVTDCPPRVCHSYLILVASISRSVIFSGTYPGQLVCLSDAQIDLIQCLNFAQN